MKTPLLTVIVSATTAASLSAFTFNVRSTADSGALTLREAIAAANASNDAERVITFSPTLVPPGSTITLSTPIEITKPITIRGHVNDPVAIPDLFWGTSIYSHFVEIE